jgi:hypothetical protein
MNDRKYNNNYCIKKDLEEILRCGFWTRYGGTFLLIPYLLQIEIEKRVEKLGLRKTDGIPVLSAVLGIINYSIFGGKRISRIGNIQDLGLAVASGLPKLPSFSFYHQFLDSIKLKDSEVFLEDIAKEFVNTGLIKGNWINFDSKFIGVWGKRRIPKGKHPTRNISMKGIDTYVVQDQDTGCPIIIRCEYLRKSPDMIGRIMLSKVSDILGNRLEGAVFDRWFSCGSLLNFIDKEIKIKFVTVLRLQNNRIEEMKKIPKEEFKEMLDKREITFIHTNVRNYEGNVRLVVVHFEENGEDKYYGYLTNDEETPCELILKRYNRRQKIENFFDEANFLNIEKLPGINLNEIQAMLMLKMLSFNIISSFKRDLGKGYSHIECETIYEKFLNSEAMVKVKGRTCKVTFFRYKMEDVVAPLYKNLADKLKSKNINPKVPWLNNRVLEFEFK